MTQTDSVSISEPRCAPGAGEQATMTVRLGGRALQVARGRNDAFWQRAQQGDWEPDTFRIFERFLDREHSYLDIGAWIGPTLLYGCQLARRAWGIEPDPLAFPELEHNIEANRPLTDNVQLVQACIAPQSGEVAFGNCGAGGDSVSSLLFGDRKTHWTVRALSFDDFIREQQIRDCNFIKMDIEGGEYQLLPTMMGWLAQHRPTLHLSLHPCHLGHRGIASVAKAAVRWAATLRILPCLRLYRHLYDHRGRPMTLRQLLWRCRARITLDVVLTDQEWNAGGQTQTGS